MQDSERASFKAISLLNEYVSTDVHLIGSDNHQSLQVRLQQVHREMRTKPGFEPLSRIAVALYHSSIDTVATLIESCVGGPAIGRYEARLSDSPSLRQIATTGEARIIDEIAAGRGSPRGTALHDLGYRASMALPIHSDSGLFGFVFMDATVPHFFDEPRVQLAGTYAKVVALLLIHELLTVRLVRAVAKTALAMARLRDDETGAHLDRMSNYARLIASAGAEKWGLSDEFIEFLFLFAPLHDIGKVGVPDNILLKPGKLTDTEMVEMRRHVAYGIEIMDALVGEFGLGAIPHLEIARNIIAGHHENVDGSGYPKGQLGDQIPLEGRIVAVADVFDALTSERPYKPRWSNEEAFKYIDSLAGSKFDRECVELFRQRREEILAIQRRVEMSVAA